MHGIYRVLKKRATFFAVYKRNTTFTGTYDGHGRTNFTLVYPLRSRLGASQVLCLVQHHINLGIGVYMYVAFLPSYSFFCYLKPFTSSGAMSATAAHLAS